MSLSRLEFLVKMVKISQTNRLILSLCIGGIAVNVQYQSDQTVKARSYSRPAQKNQTRVATVPMAWAPRGFLNLQLLDLFFPLFMNFSAKFS